MKSKLESEVHKARFSPSGYIPIQFFSAKGIKDVHKKNAYEGLVLSILLYGCETWSLTKQQLNRLQMFHNRCVRAMCRVTMWHVREHRITQQSLESRIQLEPFQYYLARRRLRWAGHVSRMDFTRLPRMFSSSWVDHKWPRVNLSSTMATDCWEIFKMLESMLKLGTLLQVIGIFGTR